MATNSKQYLVANPSKFGYSNHGSPLKEGRLAKSSLNLKGALFDLAINTFMGVQSGESLPNAVLKGAGEAALWAIAPGPMGVKMGAELIAMGAGGLYKANKALTQRYNQNISSAPNFQYTDTRQALTMRQAAVQAIQGSKMNARNALGGEASLMHRDNRIY